MQSIILSMRLKWSTCSWTANWHISGSQYSIFFRAFPPAHKKWHKMPRLAILTTHSIVDGSSKEIFTLENKECLRSNWVVYITNCNVNTIATPIIIRRIITNLSVTYKKALHYYENTGQFSFTVTVIVFTSQQTCYDDWAIVMLP
jgi:hypothetical protein